jgi:hypothetical protein
MAAKEAVRAACIELVALCAARGVKLPANANVAAGSALMRTRVAGSNDLDLVRGRQRAAACSRTRSAAVPQRLRVRQRAACCA